MRRWTIVAVAVWAMAGLALAWAAEAPPATGPSTSPSTRPAAKPLSEQVKRGAGWLAENQLKDGAWGQGEESKEMGGGGELKGQPNVADTCMALMALCRTGSTPQAGVYSENVRRGLDFVCKQVESADDKSLFITDLRNTRTQQKLGTHIDTFLAAQVLAEMKGKMATAVENARVEAALKKVVKKIEGNQKQDGQWVQEGWAPALAQAQATKALNTAAQSGVAVDEKVRERAEGYARASFGADVRGTGVGGPAGGGAAGESRLAAGGAAAPATGSGSGGVAGDAGVKLYGKSGNIAAMQSSAQRNAELKVHYEQVAKSAATSPADRERAAQQLERFKANDFDLALAQKDVVARLDDKQFIAGFGSNGGEEFLSYLNIGESLLAKGGEDWSKWDQKISQSLNTVQNEDGSWTGHHCITGRTFCTSAALMVLTIDRAPAAVGEKIGKQ